MTLIFCDTKFTWEHRLTSQDWPPGPTSFCVQCPAQCPGKPTSRDTQPQMPKLPPLDFRLINLQVELGISRSYHWFQDYKDQFPWRQIISLEGGVCDSIPYWSPSPPQLHPSQTPPSNLLEFPYPKLAILVFISSENQGCFSSKNGCCIFH